MKIDDKIKVALPDYLKILNNEKKPRFKTANLNEKLKKAEEILKSCVLCERRCKVNRLKSELGFCKVGEKSYVFSYFAHIGEERFFVPSFTIFFIGCNFSCQFCQNVTISQSFEKGIYYSPEELAEIINRQHNCLNINFVGGEPTPHLAFILKTLKHVKIDLPVVWNSNFYMSKETIELLKGVVDVYLSDWKYYNNKCAERLSKVKNYLEIIKKNHLLAFNDAELVIRHLVLPNHFDCCTRPILEFIAKNLGKKAIVNIMDQYRPEYKAENHKDIGRYLDSKEFEKVITLAERLGVNFVT